jgi:hypothetical protein
MQSEASLKRTTERKFLKTSRYLRYVLVIIFYCKIAMCYTNAVCAQTRTLTDNDRMRVHQISAQFTMSDVDSVPKIIADELQKHFESIGTPLRSQHKLTFVLLPIFSNRVSIEDRIWYGNYLLNYQLPSNAAYPQLLIKNYLEALQNNKSE